MYKEKSVYNPVNDKEIPRPEHPRPQMERSCWMNLNGWWDFAVDAGNSGKEQAWFRNDHLLAQNIQVPFCPESRLSGIGQTDFMPAVWYRRAFELQAEQVEGHVLLHFGAVDYHCEIWVNEQPAGIHDGGYSSFTFDISKLVQVGENTLTVYASDDLRNHRQPGGKQSKQYHSHDCMYTRTTGIWQTVWLEFVSACYIREIRTKADHLNRQVVLTVRIDGIDPRVLKQEPTIYASVYDQENQSLAAAGRSIVHAGQVQCVIPWPEGRDIRTWGPGRPDLYDLELKLETRAGTVLDQVRSYFGFRNLDLRADGLYINGQPVFQRLILDQGFYPEGVYTAPFDRDLRKDIELSMSLGFNGARLHQKVFEERYLYWADRLGYLVWGEQASWGLDITSADGLAIFLPEWLEILDRDVNHPSIIGWCPFNETWDIDGRPQDDRVLRQIYQVTKAVDPTRPVIDTSGNYHVLTDIFDVHDYEQDPVEFATHYQAMKQGGEVYNHFTKRQVYGGQPYMVSEYGGARWNPDCPDGWGYGINPSSPEEFADRYCALTGVLISNPRICGFCYTQLTDVEQEQNGLFTYERKSKFTPELYKKIRQANLTSAAFERLT